MYLETDQQTPWQEFPCILCALKDQCVQKSSHSPSLTRLIQSIQFISCFLQTISWMTQPRGQDSCSIFRRLKILQTLSQCLNNWVLHRESIWRSGCTDPRFLGPNTSWRWVASFIPQIFRRFYAQILTWKPFLPHLFQPIIQ
jgi:hypothetical protein